MEESERKFVLFELVPTQQVLTTEVIVAIGEMLGR